MDRGIQMDPTDTQSSHALTDDQIERLAVAVLNQFGSELSRIEFNQAVLMLLEDVAGWLGMQLPRQVLIPTAAVI